MHPTTLTTPRPRAFTVGGALAAALSLVAPATAPGQTPKVFHACYVPATGTVYRIKELGLDQECKHDKHVEFAWTDGLNALRHNDAAGGDLGGTYPNPTVTGLQGRPVVSTAPTAGQVLAFDGVNSRWAPATPAAGATDHGALGGLADDDHPQYLLGDGVRNTTDGFAVTGTFASGTLAASGPGTRLLWYPAKAAFRAGQVTGDLWDDAQIGSGSMALGEDVLASGSNSVAMGEDAFASGSNSVAMGEDVFASAAHTVAVGFRTNASGANSMALGNLANTNNHPGAFVYGDASTLGGAIDVVATGPNQFVARAVGGVIFYTHQTLTSGVQLPPGGSSWAAVSARERKTLFEPVDGEWVLGRLRGLEIARWSYRAQDPATRHVGPMAQDFHAAFGVGESDTTITGVDADGIALLAAQALERRTTELQAEHERLRNEAEELRRQNRELRWELDAVLHRLSTLEARRGE